MLYAGGEGPIMDARDSGARMPVNPADITRRPMTEPQVAQLFADHGLRCTRQRRAIYEALAKAEHHPTADELYRDVAPALDGVSKATVYNTLEAFCDAGIARRLPRSCGSTGGGSSRYDATCEPHLHLRCRASDAIVDVPEHLSRQVLDRIPPEVIDRIESELGFDVADIRIELLGEYDAAARTA